MYLGGKRGTGMSSEGTTRESMGFLTERQPEENNHLNGQRKKTLLGERRIYVLPPRRVGVEGGVSKTGYASFGSATDYYFALSIIGVSFRLSSRETTW